MRGENISRQRKERIVRAVEMIDTVDADHQIQATPLQRSYNSLVVPTSPLEETLGQSSVDENRHPSIRSQTPAAWHTPKPPDLPPPSIRPLGHGLNSGRGLPNGVQVYATNSDRRVVSRRGYHHKATLSVRGKGNTGFKIFPREIGKIIQNFCFRHIRS